jgi:hypothetical protein
MLAGLSPSRLALAKVREPTGSPVVINVSTMAVRISRSRASMLGSEGINISRFFIISPDFFHPGIIS